MTPRRLLAWRRRLGISPVMEKRLRRLIVMVQREEREACVQVAMTNGSYDSWTTQVRIIDAIRNRK